jgi:hypothetical protein
MKKIQIIFNLFPSYLEKNTNSAKMDIKKRILGYNLLLAKRLILLSAWNNTSK